jgi:hypothetical protein
MRPHCWIDWRRPKRIAVFAAAVILISIFWSYVAANIQTGNIRGRFVGGPSRFAMYMFVGWVGGWFLGLFVKAEDLNSTTSYPFQSLCHTIAALMVLVGMLSGAFLWIAF